MYRIKNALCALMEKRGSVGMGRPKAKPLEIKEKASVRSFGILLALDS